MAKGINEAGRGFNVVVIDPNTKEVIRVGHFDTYAEGDFMLFKIVILCHFNLICVFVC